jgi:hypothetical protein
MTTFVANVPVRSKRFAVPVGAPLILDMRAYPYPLTVTAIPGAGGTINIEVSTYPNNPADTSATWEPWPSGSVTARTSDVLTAPVAWLRATVTTAAGAVEFAG